MTAETYFGQHMKKLRKARGISQEELAHRANIHASYVSQLERGVKSPSLGVILDIASALEFPAWRLVCDVEEQLAQSTCPK